MGLCNNYPEGVGGGGGLGNQRGGIRENHNYREGGLDVNFKTYGGGGGLVFALFFHKLEKW